MLNLRIAVPADRADAVLGLLANDSAVSSISRMPGASIKPAGDLILADVAREGADGVLCRLRELGVHTDGAIAVQPVPTWMSRQGFTAERETTGSSADAVVWPEVVQHAYEDTELNWTYGSFFTLATLIAAVAIVLDSQVLVIGAMVLGPEFGPIVALGVGLVRRRRGLFVRAARTLLIGFVIAIALATLAALAVRGAGWVTAADLRAERPQTEFIYSPDRWSFVVAVIAAVAGTLSLTSSRLGGLSGVFISVTTVPAAGNIALGLAFGLGEEVRGSAAQLAINIIGMAVAGWATLALQAAVWGRVSARRRRFAAAARRRLRLKL